MQHRHLVPFDRTTLDNPFLSLNELTLFIGRDYEQSMVFGFNNNRYNIEDIRFHFIKRRSRI